MWIDFFVIFFALASLFFSWKYIYEVAILYNELKMKYTKQSYTKAYKEQKNAYRKIRDKNLMYKRELSDRSLAREKEEDSSSSLNSGEKNKSVKGGEGTFLGGDLDYSVITHNLLNERT